MLYDDLEDRYANTSLGRLHYKWRKGRKTVVFLHGIGGSALTWKRLVEELPEDLGLCLVDLLGHGDSEAPEIKYKVSIQAEAVIDLMGSAGVRDACLFGHSYGGWIAAKIAQEAYGAEGLILEDAAGLKEYFDDILKAGDAERLKEELIKGSLLTNHREHVIKSTVESETPDEYLTKESLAKIAIPTLIIWGADDLTLDAKYAKIFSRYIRNSTVAEINGAGHIPHYTAANEVAGLLVKFVG